MIIYTKELIRNRHSFSKVQQKSLLQSSLLNSTNRSLTEANILFLKSLKLKLK